MNDQKIKIVFVCLGNICRSPIAEFVMKSLLGDRCAIESRATSSWEHGNPIHSGSQEVMKEHGISFDSSKSSQQIDLVDFSHFDYIIGMDQSNLRDLKQMAPQSLHHKIYAFSEQDIPDPWYTGDFQETYDLIVQGCQDWKSRLSKSHHF
ncbi:low molecular weight protein-tyrosine-phosphatase [Streptococcus sp. DD13]|uniref:low molecular weight protein-tyrosine-phosphatase n=1 Tax=Streptococcus sp. DD13 TaxID=1777881 RepID=UPI0007933655|nr:low molecular weight protein-tyrosine-phosphatase [Streptococcus sp. DD13]KXT78763.1 Low molecular weight protein tyrosine phosphatase [Streptococcus sp. DD13]